MMRAPARTLAAACASACLYTATAAAQEGATLNLRVQAESLDAGDDYIGRGGRSGRTFEHAELRWQYNAPWRTAVRGVLTARKDSGGGNGGGNGGGVRINELSLERPLGAGFLTAGKKVMSWDVGYAFRPLDVVQQEDRRAINPVTLEGVPMLAWEAFDADRALTVVLSNPGRSRQDQPRDDGSLAVRLYRQHGARDEYAVLRISSRNGVEGGVSFSQVASPEFELHGSVLLQQRHDVWLVSRTAAPHWQRSAGNNGGGKALAGFTWTNEAKFSVLGEAWLDRTASAQQQQNLLLRAAQDSGDFDVSADVLWQPQNGSKIASVGVSWKPGPWLFSAGVRRYGGIAGSKVRSIAVAAAQYAY
jgi:hypothetical protein